MKPPFDEALQLLDKILDFLNKAGGHYKEDPPDWLKEHLIIAIATGQYYFKEDAYFVCWWMVNEEELEGIHQHIRPDTFDKGDIMYVPECACKDKEEMKEIRKKLRQHAINGVHWHRSGKGWRHFPRQGGVYGK